MRTVEKLDSYLGLPFPVGRKKSLAFTDIINRCTCKVKSWSKHLLSYGGKEVFIKTIIQAILTYAFSVFLAPKGDVLSYKRCDKPSFTWASIAKAVDALKDGFIWQVGDGNGIDLKREYWGLNGIFGESVCRSPLTDNERKVKDLWDQDNRRWKRERVKEIYGDYLGECICNLPIPPNDIKDTRTWIQNLHGIYTSKSAYSWLILKEGFINICPRCQSKDESLIHALKDCPKARGILVAGGLNNKLLEGDYTECIDWLEDVFKELDKKATADFLTLLWNSWNDRNNMVFKGKMDDAFLIWERAQALSKDFRIFNLTEPPVIPSTSMNRVWKAPPTGYIKVNVDAAVSDGCSGFGVVIRDNDGFVMGGCYKFRAEAMDVCWAELQALIEGLKLAKKLKATQLILESDNAMLVNKVNRRAQDIAILGQRTTQVCEAFKNFNSVQINWVHRLCNKVADFLSTLAITNKCDLYFDMDYPMEIHNFIIHDAIK
ncbi:hypothetical protein V6Z11_A11G271600 [Gossypium hirsutum]